MIKFQGELSPECKKWFLKREYIAGIWVGGTMALLTIIISLILAFTVNLFGLLGLIGAILIIVFVCVPQFSNSIIWRAPSAVSIEYGFIEGENEREDKVLNLDYVKSVIDYGDWYIFVFYFPHKTRWFVCQKDLIVEGTIEEFEQLFEGKIIRKYK